jgi:hypothetical protein
VQVVGQIDSIHARNTQTHHAEMRDEPAKYKGKSPNRTAFADQVVQGLLITLLRSGNTLGIDYRVLAKIQNQLWRRRRLVRTV